MLGGARINALIDPQINRQLQSDVQTRAHRIDRFAAQATDRQEARLILHNAAGHCVGTLFRQRDGARDGQHFTGRQRGHFAHAVARHHCGRHWQQRLQCGPGGQGRAGDQRLGKCVVLALRRVGQLGTPVRADHAFHGLHSASAGGR